MPRGAHSNLGSTLAEQIRRNERQVSGPARPKPASPLSAIFCRLSRRCNGPKWVENGHRSSRCNASGVINLEQYITIYMHEFVVRLEPQDYISHQQEILFF
jgi:hypothetical protein